MSRVRKFMVAMFAAAAGCGAVPKMAAAAPPLAYETIQPAQIVIGESAVLKVTSLDGDLESVPLPVVAGLGFEVVGHTQQIEFINGVTLRSSSIIIRVTPQIAGIFSIPALTPKSQPLILTVNVDHSGSNPPLAISGGKVAPRPPGPVVSGNPKSSPPLTPESSAFVTLKMPKRAVYVGESVPVDIELGVRPGLVTSLNGLPTLKGGEFTLNNLSRQPERQEKIIDGSPYVILTWHSILAAVKPGDFSLSVDTPITVKVSSRPSEDAAFANLLGGPFLQNFYSNVVPRDITVTSPSSPLKVLPLPTAGRPADFSGAVGNFTISSDLSTAAAAAGEPLTLRMRVTGAGNFDRVDSSMLDHVDHWKTYPPKSSFTQSDSTGYRGEKTFEQPLIATQPGRQSIPGLSFGYFDPETRRYEYARSAPLEVTIAPSQADRALLQPEPGGSAAKPAQALAGMRPDHASTQNGGDTLIPLYMQTRFLVLPGTLLLAIAGLWLYRRGTARRSDPADVQLLRLDAAARSGDLESFFGTARTALLHDLAARWQMSPDDITDAQLEARLGDDATIIKRVFALADEAKYAGRRSEAADLSRWLRIVRGELARGKPG